MEDVPGWKKTNIETANESVGMLPYLQSSQNSYLVDIALKNSLGSIGKISRIKAIPNEFLLFYYKMICICILMLLYSIGPRAVLRVNICDRFISLPCHNILPR